MSPERESLEWTEEFFLFIVVMIVVICCCMKLMDTCKPFCGVSVLSCFNFFVAISLISGSWGSLFVLKQHWDRAHAFVSTLNNSTAVDTVLQLTAIALANAVSNGSGTPVADGG